MDHVPIAPGEFIAVTVGPGGYQSTSYDVLVPEIKNPPDHGAQLWVFEVGK